MTGFFHTHNRSFRAEWLKLKRTGLFWICLAASAFIPVITTLGFIFFSTADNNAEVWQQLMESNFKSFVGFFFPLFLVIAIVRIVYLEHRSDTWKLMETQPVSRLSLFIVKYEVAILISLFSLLTLFAFSLLSGSLLTIIRPKIGFNKWKIPWSFCFAMVFKFWLASFGFLAIQYFLSLWIKSFAWPMTIGLIANIVASMLAGFGIANWFPYGALVVTSSSLKGPKTSFTPLFHEQLSLLWAALFLLLGYWFYRHRSIARAFIKPVSRLALFLAAIAVFAVGFWWITKPVVQARYTKTIVEGRIVSDKPVTDVIIAKAPVYDTIQSAKVVNGKFRMLIPGNLPAGMYSVKIGPVIRQLFFGANDSIFLDVKIENQSRDISVLGTRIAENEFNLRTENLYFLENYPQNYDDTGYAYKVMSEWKSGLKTINKFKTSGNIKPAPDFIALQKKLFATKLLDLLDNNYPKTFAVYYPNDSLRYPAAINELRKQLDLNDTSLIDQPDFIDYLSSYYHTRAASQRNRDSAFFTGILQLPSARLKEAVLMKEAQEKIPVFVDSMRRAAFLQAIDPYITNVSYKRSIAELVARLNSIQRGKPAPDIEGEALGGKEFHLKDFARRFVVIDVWATWCGPCKREAPYFEQYAERYTSEDVAFVSISLDENKFAWLAQAPQNSKIILQLHARNAVRDLKNSYAVNTIPRFMLIDPRGNIVSANLPPPSDPEFDKVLRREIPFLSDY